MTKKFLTLICFVLLIAIRSFGQENPDSLYYMAKMKKYTNKTTAGIPLILLGVTLIIIGEQKANNSADLNEFFNGSGLFLVGAGCLGAGIPLTIVGIRGTHKYKKEYLNYQNKSSHARLNLYPRRNGLTLIYRF